MTERYIPPGGKTPPGLPVRKKSRALLVAEGVIANRHRAANPDPDIVALKKLLAKIGAKEAEARRLKVAADGIEDILHQKKPKKLSASDLDLLRQLAEETLPTSRDDEIGNEK